MKQIKTIQVQVIDGNIATMKVDAVMVPQFNNGASYGGVGGAITRSGAGSGMDEYNDYAEKKPLSYGDVYMTASGGGSAEYLLHLATVGCKADTSFACTVNAVCKALFLADEKGVKTIAVPAVGSGIIGTLTLEQSAKAIFKAVALFAEHAKSVQSVTMVVYGTSTAPAQEILDNESYLAAENETGQKEFNFAEWLEGFAKDMSGEDRY
ncbi:MAG: macro domain-containing protein [Proteobacteria bacterium]|nr:macro domain-containing protein [Pseudomonadota bacterium]